MSESKPVESIDLHAEYAKFLEEEGRAIRFEDLGGMLRDGLDPPAQLVEDLVIAQQVNWFSGHPGQGKTTVAMWAACQHMEAGGHVVWIDWEAGPRDTILRLLALGAPVGLVERFHYAYAPHVMANDKGFESIKYRLEELPDDVLVVFDSASKALSVAGLDENSPTDATRWTTSVVMPMRKLGATALVIDHVGKTATRTQPYPRGAGSKLADTEVAWYVEATEPFSQSQVGKLRLTRQKDRNGVLPLEVTLRVGDGQGGLPITRTADLPGGDASITKQELRRRVVEKLREHCGHEFTQSQLTRMVQGKAGDVQDAAKDAANDPSEPVRSWPGKGSAIMYRYDEDAVAPVARNVLGGGS